MKIFLLICTYNRPEYLYECLKSLKAADLTGVQVVFIDDASTSIKTMDLILNFPSILLHSETNKGIKHSLLGGIEFAFSKGAQIIINLDADAIVRNDFIERMIEVRNQHPNKIVTGFNCLTKNRNGSTRHRIVGQGQGWNIKQSVGGINMCFDRKLYESFIKPALLEPFGNWDHSACINADGAVCVVPSVVQHIGIESSMGHDEDPDVAEDFKPIGLTNVTLIGASCDNLKGLINAADISQRQIDFGAVKLLSSQTSDDPRVIKIPPITSKQEYNHFVIEHFADYVETEFMLIFQPDGYIVNPFAWDKRFLDYDLCGAVWYFHDKGSRRVGNGGFAIRSTRLMKIVQSDPNIILKNEGCYDHVEDHNIVRIYGDYLVEKYGITFAPEDIAERFSVEYFGVKDNGYKGSFGFHGTNVYFA